MYIDISIGLFIIVVWEKNKIKLEINVFVFVVYWCFRKSFSDDMRNKLGYGNVFYV